MYRRSVGTMLFFASAMIVAFWYPFIGFGMICCCLLLYLRPGVKGMPMKM
jgi:hypothetical protein